MISLLSLVAISPLTTKAYAMKEDEETYALAADAKGAQRLTIQNETLKKTLCAQGRGWNFLTNFYLSKNNLK